MQKVKIITENSEYRLENAINKFLVCGWKLYPSSYNVTSECTNLYSVILYREGEFQLA